MTLVARQPKIDVQRYRQVLGQYPTGVCVITAVQDDRFVGMIVGSFTSVSLEPPLVAFFPDKKSSTWEKLRGADRFCVNILSAEQEAVCRKLASKDLDRFVGINHRLSERGNPIVDGVVAWIECERYSVTDAGDHDMVLGRIVALDVVTGDLPLLFFQGGYGRFAPSSLAAGDTRGLTLEQLRNVDRARPEMDRLSSDLSARCTVTVRAGRELAVVAIAGQATRNAASTLVGQRLPFVPPTGAIFAAWLPTSEVNKWIGERMDEPQRRATLASLEIVRHRGFSVGLLNDAQRAFSARMQELASLQSPVPSESLQDMIEGLDYDPVNLSPEAEAAVRLISVPVFNAVGDVTLSLTLHDFPKPPVEQGVKSYIRRVVKAAVRITESLGGNTGVHHTEAR